MVITGHCFSYYGKAAELSQAEWGMQYILYSSHVPLFIFFAGFLCHKQNVLNFCKKKIYRILIPFWFFSLLKILYTYVVHLGSGINIGEELYLAFVEGRTYWFGYAIALMFAFAPFIWSDDKIRGEQTISLKTVFCLILLIGFNLIYSGNIISFKISQIVQLESTIIYLPYFIVGILARGRYVQIKDIFIKRKLFILPLACLCLLISLILFYKDIMINEFALKILTAFATLPIIVEISRKIPCRFIKAFKIIGEYAWQLMLLDSFFHVVLFLLLGYFFPICSLTVWIIIFLDVLLGIITCELSRRIPVVRTLFGLQS